MTGNAVARTAVKSASAASKSALASFPDPRRQGRSRRMLAQDEQRVAVLRIEPQHVVQVGQGLVEHAQGRQQPGPGQAPLRFVRFEFDGRGGVLEGPLRLSPGHRRSRPAPTIASAHRGRRQTASLKSSRAFSWFPGHAVADAAGQVGLGNLGSQLDLPGIVGDGQVDLSLAAVDPCPPGIELSRPGMEPDLLPRSGRACRCLRGGRAAAGGRRGSGPPDRRGGGPRGAGVAFFQRFCQLQAFAMRWLFEKVARKQPTVLLYRGMRWRVDGLWSAAC